MKTKETFWILAALAAPVLAQQDTEEAEEKIAAEKRHAGDDEHKTYFLIGPKNGAKAPAKGYRLLLVLPGGDGSADFHPFVKRIALHACGDDYLVAQLVAPQWDEKQAEKIVWPTEKSPYKGMKFSTEVFAAAVIEDVASKHKVDPSAIFTLSWSSGGPAAYAISLADDSRVTGSLVAMSVFKKSQLPPLRRAKSHAYYLLHSEDDRVCPFRMAQEAVDELGKAKAKVELAKYDGGHGWRGDVYGNLRKGLAWLAKNAAARR
jgi:predicted esterase